MPSPPAPESASQKGPANPFRGRTIGRCVVGEKIGRGTTSSVYRAHYGPLQRDIALKILSLERSDTADVRERFREEAKTIAKLDHENIVKVIDVVEDQGCLCILMEYVPGETLQDRLDDAKVLPPKKAIEIAASVARALEAAHDEGIIHRDIKPANMMLTKGNDHVKVVDFGLAAKGANNRVGTPLYMSPEAAQGKRIDEKSDVYALGVSLYQMLTGRHPFGSKDATVKEILNAQVNAELVPPSKVRADLGTKYDALLAKFLVKSKGYRSSASEAADLLEDFLDPPAVVAGQAAPSRRKKTTRKPPPKKSNTGLIIGIVAGIVVITVLALALSGGKKEPPPEKAPVVAPPVAPVIEIPDPKIKEAKARKAYEETLKWVAENPEDLPTEAQRWAAVEKEAAGTDWAPKAAAKRGEAEALVKRRAEVVQQNKGEDEEYRQRQEAITRKREEFSKAMAVRDYETAGRLAESMSSPTGGSASQWARKAKRISYLAEHFVAKIDAYLTGRGGLPGADFDIAKGETLKSATREGIVTNQSTVKWADIPADKLFFLARKSVSERRAEDNLFLAILAAELNLDRETKMFREQLQLVDSDGTVTEKVRDYFDVD